MNKFKKERRKKKLQDNLTTEITVRHITEVSVDPENSRFMLEENDQLNDGKIFYWPHTVANDVAASIHY